MKNILVAVDGSPASLHAARVALTLGGEVTLMHVVAPFYLPPDVPVGSTAWTDEAMQAGETVLADIAKEVGVPKARCLNVAGSPAEAIVDHATQKHFDVIVVGSKGRNAVTRVLIGSVTDRIVHISTVPVLVVR